MRQSRTLIALGIILGLLVAAVTLPRFGIESPRAATVPKSTPASDVSESTPTVMHDHRVALPPNARLATEEAAVARAKALATATGATNPQVVEVYLETLRGSVEFTQQRTREDSTLVAAPLPGEDAGRPVWRIILTGATFHIRSCPVSDGCPPTDTIQYILDAMSGSSIRITWLKT